MSDATIVVVIDTFHVGVAVFKISIPSIGRAVAVLGVSALCSTLITAPPAVAASNKDAAVNECTDYAVIGVGGSEDHDLDADDSDTQVTSLKNSMFLHAKKSIRAALPNENSVRFVPVEYSPVDEYSGMAGSMSATPDEYVAAINSGTGKFVEAVENASQCSDTKIVVFGFGQGAGVIRVSLEKLNQRSLSAIKAVWFMGDAIHDGSGKDEFEYYDGGSKWDKSYNGWTRIMDYNQKLDDEDPASEPAEFNQKGLPAPIPHTIPAALKGKILSMCHVADIACSPVEESDHLYSSADNYLEGEFFNFGANWVLKAIDAPVSAGGSSSGSLQKNEGNDVVWDQGDGATWVAEDKNDPYKFTDRCISDYAIIAARGSGEETNGGTGPNGEVGGQPAKKVAPRIPGYSDILATAAWGIRERLPSGSTVQFIPVKYPARAVPSAVTHGVKPTGPSNLGGPLLVGPLVDTGVLQAGVEVGGFLTSAVDGGESSQATIEKFIDTCPDTKVLVMGYSQGAWVVHLALNKMDSKYLKKISGAYLIADPLRNTADDAAEYFDMYVPDRGIKHDAKVAGSGVAFAPFSKRFSSDMNHKVFQVCNYADGVCNFTSNPEMSRTPEHTGTLLGVTTSYFQRLIFGSAKAKFQSISGFTTVHPHIYKEEAQFWTYPAVWGASKLMA